MHLEWEWMFKLQISTPGLASLDRLLWLRKMSSRQRKYHRLLL